MDTSEQTETGFITHWPACEITFLCLEAELVITALQNVHQTNPALLKRGTATGASELQHKTLTATLSTNRTSHLEREQWLPQFYFRWPGSSGHS